MYCKNCGNEINENQKFCTKCGSIVVETPTTSISTGTATDTKVKSIAENKKLILIAGVVLAIAVILIIVIAAVNGNNPEKKLVGHWEPVDSTQISETKYTYPGEEIYFYENSDMSAEGLSGNYYINDNIITMSFWLGSYTYEFKVHGNTLELKNNDNPEDAPTISYYRVD